MAGGYPCCCAPPAGSSSSSVASSSRGSSQPVRFGCQSGCCGLQDATEEYVVDLGGGGWTAGNCANCAAVAGEFTVRRFADCGWRFVHAAWCAQTCAPAAPQSPFWTLSIVLTREGALQCRWRVQVLLSVLLNSSSESPCGIAQATYLTAFAPRTAPCAGSFTLSKSLELATAVQPCFGALPATIGVHSA